jgi:hypothetical protein
VDGGGPPPQLGAGRRSACEPAQLGEERGKRVGEAEEHGPNHAGSPELSAEGPASVLSRFTASRVQRCSDRIDSGGFTAQGGTVELVVVGPPTLDALIWLTTRTCECTVEGESGPRAPPFEGTPSNGYWWAATGSNRRPLACQAGGVDSEP